MERNEAMEYACKKFPELSFGNQIKIATAYLDGCIDTTRELTDTVRDGKERLKQESREIDVPYVIGSADISVD